MSETSITKEALLEIGFEFLEGSVDSYCFPKGTDSDLYILVEFWENHFKVDILQMDGEWFKASITLKNCKTIEQISTIISVAL